jgi:hypothetical protein
MKTVYNLLHRVYVFICRHFAWVWIFLIVAAYIGGFNRGYHYWPKMIGAKADAVTNMAPLDQYCVQRMIDGFKPVY